MIIRTRNAIKSNAKITCPTHNQCEIQEVFASRIQDLTRAQVCSTKDNATKSKSTKRLYKKAM